MISVDGSGQHRETKPPNGGAQRPARAAGPACPPASVSRGRFAAATGSGRPAGAEPRAPSDRSLSPLAEVWSMTAAPLGRGVGLSRVPARPPLRIGCPPGPVAVARGGASRARALCE
jgi:hypothetical protein